jgi:hypothetical protein
MITGPLSPLNVARQNIDISLEDVAETFDLTVDVILDLMYGTLDDIQLRVKFFDWMITVEMTVLDMGSNMNEQRNRVDGRTAYIEFLKACID